MNKLRIKLNKSAKRTLEDSLITREVLLENIDVETDCMGLRVTCVNINCHECPLSVGRGKTRETIIAWLDETCPEEKPDTKSYKMPLAVVGLVLVGVVVWKFK